MAGHYQSFHFPLKTEIIQKSELYDNLKHVFKSLAATAEEYRYSCIQNKPTEVSLISLDGDLHFMY